MTKPLAIIAGVGPGTVSHHRIDSDGTHLINQQGASIARRFAQAYSVILLARNSANFDPLVKEINTAGGQALGIRTDLSDSTSVHSALDQITKQYHGSSLAAAVFNVGGGFVRKPFLELTETEFSQGFESQGWVTDLPYSSPPRLQRKDHCIKTCVD